MCFQIQQQVNIVRWFSKFLVENEICQMGRGSGAHRLCLLSLGRNLPFHGDTSWRRVPALREVKWDLSQIYNYVRWSSKNSTVVRQYHVVGLDLNFDFSLRKKINLQTCSYQPEANL